MRDIDKMIRDVLGTEDAKLVESVTGEQGVFEMVVESFRGKTGWPANRLRNASGE